MIRGAVDVVPLGFLVWRDVRPVRRRRRPRPVVVQWSLTAETLQKIFDARRIVVGVSDN